MAAKPDRYKKLPPVKRKKVTPTSSIDKGPKGRIAKAEMVLDQEKAAHELSHRATKDFSTAELGALMQVPPGGAEPHQIKKQSRQFNRVAGDMPEATVSDRLIGVPGDYKKRPMSAKTPKIDPED